MPDPSAADQLALAALADAAPRWTATTRLSEAVGLPRSTFLHAGPPLTGWDEAPPPLRNAACVAALFEGAAQTRAEAEALFSRQELQLVSAQSYRVVTPLAHVCSASMLAHIVEARMGSTPWASPLNEGGGSEAIRFGGDHPGAVERLRFVHREIGPALAAMPPVDLFEIARLALTEGDDLHGRVAAGSTGFASVISKTLGPDHPTTKFFATNPNGFLNPWMAACAAILDLMAGVPSARVIVGAGGNGVRFGIRLSGDPQTWHVGPAKLPEGALFDGVPQDTAKLPAIGDSPVIDAIGLGALALDAAPDLARLLGPAATTIAGQQAGHLAGRLPGLDRAAGLIWDGTIQPVVVLAALDAAGHLGLVGRGLTPYPDVLSPSFFSSHTEGLS